MLFTFNKNNYKRQYKICFSLTKEWLQGVFGPSRQSGKYSNY